MLVAETETPDFLKLMAKYVSPEDLKRIRAIGDTFGDVMEFSWKMLGTRKFIAALVEQNNAEWAAWAIHETLIRGDDLWPLIGLIIGSKNERAFEYMFRHDASLRDDHLKALTMFRRK